MKPGNKECGLETVAATLRAVDLVSYQNASVVSRTIMDKGTGTVTLFAFDEKQGLSEHTAPYNAMVYILDGEALVKIGNKTHLLKMGEMIIMPANEPHAIEAVKQFKMMLVMIRS